MILNFLDFSMDISVILTKNQIFDFGKIQNWKSNRLGGGKPKPTLQRKDNTTGDNATGPSAIAIATLCLCLVLSPNKYSVKEGDIL